jgi:membrane protease YdiL (CAAX protease family)
VSNGVEQPVNAFTVVDAVTIFGGVALFARWLLSTSLGRESLADSKPRRNCMARPRRSSCSSLAARRRAAAAAHFHIMGNAAPAKAFWGQLASSIGSLGVVVIILILAKLDFARGLKGLGLRLKTAPKDLGLAFLTLLAVWPLVLAAMSLTILVTREVSGREYQVPQHEALKLITEYPALPLQVLLVVMAVVVAPIVEEMLFRGLFQTTIRSYLQRPWPAIVLTSILFASIHPYVSHWPSLFVLALGLGYAYERSGSLLRPIFMHALFNGINVAGVLTQQPGWIY